VTPNLTLLGLKTPHKSFQTLILFLFFWQVVILLVILTCYTNKEFIKKLYTFFLLSKLQIGYKSVYFIKAFVVLFKEWFIIENHSYFIYKFG
jgi:hypothetical protein